ncbi:MAG TPA: non-heme iron oxygenase ferredoxin subunit [Microbacteriaceae bacterium]|nr:non-heme iron oxygenase ferredoxin subunit [Microbacteriaceae bacterium]
MTEELAVAKVGEIGEDEAIVVPRATTGTLDDVAVVYTGGEYFALDNTCTHEEASLAEGWIEDGIIECPLHASGFCVRDGAVQNLPASRDVAVHAVRVEGDDILVTPNPDRLA